MDCLWGFSMRNPVYYLTLSSVLFEFLETYNAQLLRSIWESKQYNQCDKVGCNESFEIRFKY